MLSRALTATLASPIIMPAIASSLTRIPQLINRSLPPHGGFSAIPSQPDEKKLLISEEKDVKPPTQTKTTNFSTLFIKNQTMVKNFMRTPFLETTPKKRQDFPDNFLIPENKLQPGYQALHDSVNDLLNSAVKAAVTNLFDYFSGPSVGEAREKFTAILKNCKNAEEVLKVLIDHNIIDNGGMIFLKEWVKGQDSIGVRIGRNGSAILHKRTFSLGGPYPIKTFPERDENEETATLKPK